MEFDSAILIEYLQPYIVALCMGFGLSCIVTLLMLGIHKALSLFNV